MLRANKMYRLRYFDKRYHCYGVSYVVEREILFDDLDSAFAYITNDVTDSVWIILRYLDRDIVARSSYV